MYMLLFYSKYLKLYIYAQFRYPIIIFLGHGCTIKKQSTRNLSSIGKVGHYARGYAHRTVALELSNAEESFPSSCFRSFWISYFFFF